MKRPGSRDVGQQSDPTIELNDSSLLPVKPAVMSPAKLAAAKAAKKNQDVSLWRGEVLASDDFVPARGKRRFRPWLLVALVAGLGLGAAAYLLTRGGSNAAAPAATGSGSAAVGSGSAGPAAAIAPATAPDAAPAPAVAPAPVALAEADAISGADAAAKPVVKKAQKKGPKKKVAQKPAPKKKRVAPKQR